MSDAAAALPPPPGWNAWDELMAEALSEARAAGSQDEVPVGAILVDSNGAIIGRGRNGPIAANDPTAHAEIAAIRAACTAARNYRLPGAVLVVTLEPCLMCLGAAVHARLEGIVFGAHDPKAGAVESCLDGPNLPFLNHRPLTLGGIRAEECGALLSEFFQKKRLARGKGGRGDKNHAF